MMEIDKHLMPGKLTKITHSFVITICVTISVNKPTILWKITGKLIYCGNWKCFLEYKLLHCCFLRYLELVIHQLFYISIQTFSDWKWFLNFDINLVDSCQKYSDNNYYYVIIWQLFESYQSRFYSLTAFTNYNRNKYCNWNISNLKTVKNISIISVKIEPFLDTFIITNENTSGMCW